MQSRLRTSRGLAAATVSGGLFFAAFPPLDCGVLALVAFVPLLLTLRKSTPAQAFACGWWMGTLGCSLLVSPSIYTAAANYFHGATWMYGGFALLAPQLYAAPYFGLFALVARDALQPGRGKVRLWQIPAAWVAIDFARANVWHGCPWVLLGHSMHAHPAWIQIADLAGVYGISFVLQAVNVAIACLLQPRSPSAGTRAPSAVSARSGSELRGFVSTVAVLVAATLAYGIWQLGRWDALTGEPLRVALVQPNLPRRQRASALQASAAVDRLRELTRGIDEPAAGTVPSSLDPASPPHTNGVDLVIWPENAIGFVLPANQSLLARMAQDLPPQARLLVGSPRVVEGAGAPFRNSAFLVDAGGSILDHYDKIRLTPYAEAAPFGSSSSLGRRFVAADTYGPGEERTLFVLGDHRFAALICFEAIYPDLVRQFVAEGAQLLVNLSNDDWFGDRAAIEQHLIAVLFRAVESRRFLLRDTNTGRTAILDPAGRVVAELPRDRADVLIGSARAVDELTIYTRYGDLFAVGCVGLTLATLAVRRRRAPATV